MLEIEKLIINEMDDKKIINLIRDKLWDLVKQSLVYKRRRNMFKYWQTLKEWEWWFIKSQINFFYRFCKTHASYVVKDSPNIQVPPKQWDNEDSKIQASRREKVLYTYWRNNKLVQKLKHWALRWAVFWDMYLFSYISTNNWKKYVKTDLIDPSLLMYDRYDSTQDSDIQYVLTAKLIDVDYLNETYWKDEKWKIIYKFQTSSEITDLLKVSDFEKSTLFNKSKAVLFTYIDNKYIYEIVNWNKVISKKEHWYDKIHLYHWRYVDIWDKYWLSQIDIMYEAVKHLHLSLSLITTNAYDTAETPIVSDWLSPNIIDWKKTNRWLITIAPWSRFEYLNPPRTNSDLYRILEYAKAFMHFVSWLSEEAMAWFTGSLTSAWVAIELRLDSTVREVLDSQMSLKTLLEELNADALKLMEKHLNSVNLFETLQDWIIDDYEFTWKMINWCYYNIIDFWGILPRNETQTINNVITKYKQQMISLDTALEELRYIDPSLEKSKMFKEQIDDFKMKQAIMSGKTTDIVWFSWPEEENYSMIKTGKIAMVYPEQNHTEHLVEHQEMNSKINSPIITAHMKMHQAMMNKWWVNNNRPVMAQQINPNENIQMQQPMQQMWQQQWPMWQGQIPWM